MFLAVSWQSRLIGKPDGSPNSHSWLTAADEVFGLDQLPSIFHLHAKWDPKQEMPSDSLGVSRWLILLSSFPGNQEDLRTVVCVLELRRGYKVEEYEKTPLQE